MKFFILLIFLLEVTFIAYDLYRKRFTKRLMECHQQIYSDLGSPSVQTPTCSKLVEPQNALINQARYIHSSNYLTVKDKIFSFTW